MTVDYARLALDWRLELALEPAEGLGAERVRDTCEPLDPEPALALPEPAGKKPAEAPG